MTYDTENDRKAKYQSNNLTPTKKYDDRKAKDVIYSSKPHS